ncbi:MAG: YajG family lipoprotein [Campylobacterales bacterium]|nr:YajG family lipoprotein [Campylobacterales bacterium]
MKNLFFVVLVAFLVSGCTYKNEAVNLHAYKADYAGPISQLRKSVYIELVNDTRNDKRSIGSVIEKGEKLATLYSDENFAEKYKEGLGYALNMAGFKTATNPDEAALVMEVYIRDIKILYNDKSFDENLKGSIEIDVKIKSGEYFSTQSFRQKGGKWIAPSYSSKNVEPFLYSLFSDSINDIVSRLTRY